MIITKRYLYPPRPGKSPVPRDSLASYELMGYAGQIKYNDIRALFSVDSGDITTYGRHNNVLSYMLSDSQKADILGLIDKLGLDRSKWHYLDGGILHHKSKIFSDIVVIWDILVADGDWLLGSTYADRYDRLTNAVDKTPWIKKIGGLEFDLGYRVGDQVLIPKMYRNYDDVWAIVNAVNSAAGWTGSGEPAVEGCVIKKMDAPLRLTINDVQACGWMTRSRVSTGRHRY